MHNDNSLNILRNATREMLIKSGNKEYLRIYAERQDLMRQVEKLNTHIEFLEEYQEKQEKRFIETIANMGINTTARNSVTAGKTWTEQRTDALRMVFPLAFKSCDEDSDIVEDHEDYPGVKYWTMGSFDANRENPGVVSNKRLRFLEDENGKPMTQRRLDEMRKFLNGAFKELKELMYPMPPSWATGANRELMAKCHSELGRRFPELTYLRARLEGPFSNGRMVPKLAKNPFAS